MEHFFYACINILLLGGAIFLIGRKPIVRMFRSRRERINRELDELEAPEAPPGPAEAELPAGDDSESTSQNGEAAEKAAFAARFYIFIHQLFKITSVIKACQRIVIRHFTDLADVRHMLGNIYDPDHVSLSIP